MQTTPTDLVFTLDCSTPDLEYQKNPAQGALAGGEAAAAAGTGRLKSQFPHVPQFPTAQQRGNLSKLRSYNNYCGEKQLGRNKEKKKLKERGKKYTEITQSRRLHANH